MYRSMGSAIVGPEWSAMADPLVTVATLLAPAFARRGRGETASIPSCARQRPRRRAGQRRAGAGQAARPQPARGRPGGRRRRRPRRRVQLGRGRRPGLHQRHVRRRVPRRAARSHRGRRSPRRAGAGARRERSSSTTRRPTSPRRCTSATCAPRSSATRWCACSTFVGHRVIRENHIGDWGTPFGMLIEHMLDIGETRPPPKLCRSATSTASTSRHAPSSTAVRGVQGAGPRPGRAAAERDDPETLAHLGSSSSTCRTRYFNARVPQARRAAHRRRPRRRERATTAACPGRRAARAGRAARSRSTAPRSCSRPASPTARASRCRSSSERSAGGFNYATSDLACVLDRVERLGADLLLYVVGAPQAQHFADGVRGRRDGRLAAPADATRCTCSSATCSARTARC